MSTSKAQQRATIKYMKNNYDELKIRIPKGRKAEIDARVKAEGQSINGIVNGFLREYLGVSQEEWKKVEKGE